MNPNLTLNSICNPNCYRKHSTVDFDAVVEEVMYNVINMWHPCSSATIQSQHYLLPW